jgi:hypothetical protein
MATPIVSAATPAEIEKRRICEQYRSQLWTERSTFDAHWKDVAEHILPRRARFTTFDVNRGDKRHNKIIDSSATMAVRTLRSGMMAGVTSPARPWFRLSVPYPDLAEQPEVKDYLYEVTRRMEHIFVASNLYNKLPTVYGDLGVFGTSAMSVMEDDEDVIRCYDFPLGSYVIANDGKLRPRTFIRAFRLSVQQVVENWGNIDPKTGEPDFVAGRPTNISPTVQDQWNRGNRFAWVDLVHTIQPNSLYDGVKFESKYKRFECLYYEQGRTDVGFLERTGYDEFPVLVPRWEVSGEDVYGTNCPGMEALGDIKQLQQGEKRSAQAVEKSINPPLTAPVRLQNQRVSMLPGDITYVDTRDGQDGVRATYEVNFDVSKLEQKQQQVRLRVQRAFFEDLFLMFASSDRREITAREVDERHEEKLLALGPVLEQLNQDLLDPLIERTFNIMNRRGLLPEVPDALNGVPLKIEYISIMAQAQKAIGLAGLERFAGFVGQVATVSPDILDRVDNDELIESYADGTGIPPKILRSVDDAQQIRDQRAKAAQVQQAAQNAPQIAGAVRDLSQSPTGDGHSALSQLLGNVRAKAQLNATSGPPNVGLN